MSFQYKNLKKQSKFVLQFLVIASIIFLISYFGENTYTSLIRKAVSIYYNSFKSILGLQPPTRLYTDILLLQEVSFFALILVVPKIPFKRKIKFLIIGSIIFFATDILFTLLELSFQNSLTWILLSADFLKLALPISLWFVFSYNYFVNILPEK
jgi:hypothetical protein